MSTAMVSVPDTAARDEIVEVKILISHPMETGFRTGSDGSRIPRDIIHSLRCIYNGEEVFRTEIFPAIAANPYFAFYLRATESGDVTLIWADEQGQEFAETKEITVS